MASRIEQIDTATAPEEDLRALHELCLVWEREDIPGETPMPFAQRLVQWRHIASFVNVPRWVAFESNSAVATGGLELEYRDENRENCFAWLYVHPDHRGLGLARALAGPLLGHASADGRLRVGTSVVEGSANEGFARKAGLQPRYHERQSRLRIDRLDRGLIRHWIDRAGERASGYELVLWQGRIPDEHLQPFCDLMYSMNTAPREDYVEEDERLTPGLCREMEEEQERQAAVIWTYVARHKGTGELAGMTNVILPSLFPGQVYQGDTVVHPDHRNKGLGRWLKAAMLELILSERPEAERIDTFNADSNQPMLTINVALGFEPILMTYLWQGEIATARERLGV